MHDAAHHYVAQFATPEPLEVFELGSLNINGGIRDLFPNSTFTGVDIVGGVGVDIVADAETWRCDSRADLVLCCEVFEHTARWPAIIANIRAHLLRVGGRVILTMAGPGRAEHSAVDGGALRPGEFYENVDPQMLYGCLADSGFQAIEIDVLGPDLRATGVR